MAAPLLFRGEAYVDLNLLGSREGFRARQIRNQFAMFFLDGEDQCGVKFAVDVLKSDGKPDAKISRITIAPSKSPPEVVGCDASP